MKPKTTLLVSIALTAFVLVIVANVVSSASAQGGSSIFGDDPQLQQAILDREATYNQMLEEANNRIVELQAELDKQQGSVNDSEIKVTPEQAIQIAEGAAAFGATYLGNPELVSFEGAVAYEVPYQEGNIYIAADTGEVLFNGTLVLAPSRINAEDAAQIASNYLNNPRVTNVKMTYLNGELVWAVGFKNGDVVFVSDTGELLLVRLESGGGGSSSRGSDDDHDEREHEDDD